MGGRELRRRRRVGYRICRMAGRRVGDGDSVFCGNEQFVGCGEVGEARVDV